MLIQVNAYPVLDQMHLQVTRMEVTGEGRHWAHLMMETVNVADLDQDDAWDMVWAVAQAMMDECMRRIDATRRGPGYL